MRKSNNENQLNELLMNPNHEELKLLSKWLNFVDVANLSGMLPRMFVAYANNAQTKFTEADFEDLVQTQRLFYDLIESGSE